MKGTNTVELDGIERINLGSVMPEQAGRYKMMVAEEIIEATKLTTKEMDACAKEKDGTKLDPDEHGLDIPKLKEIKKKTIVLSGFGVKLIEERLNKMDKDGTLKLFHLKLWDKILGEATIPEDLFDEEDETTE